MITYQPSPHFKQRLRDFDNTLFMRWSEATETLEIYSKTDMKRPVLEHSYKRNNREREVPKMNWDMEWEVLQRLDNGRRWQHMSAQEFQDDMIAKRDKFREDGEKQIDAEFEGFLGDKYWHKKRLQEFDNNDFGTCTTQWAGTTPEGNKKNDENMEPK